MDDDLDAATGLAVAVGAALRAGSTRRRPVITSEVRAAPTTIAITVTVVWGTTCRDVGRIFTGAEFALTALIHAAFALFARLTCRRV